jgi:hypothetical protein
VSVFGPQEPTYPKTLAIDAASNLFVGFHQLILRYDDLRPETRRVLNTEVASPVFTLSEDQQTLFASSPGFVHAIDVDSGERRVVFTMPPGRRGGRGRPRDSEPA